LYWVTDGSYNTMFLVTNKGVVAVDAPPSIGNNYLKAIAKVTDKPVTYVIYSHAHTDHIGAASHIALNNYDFDTYVGGHLTRLGTRNDVIVQKEFVSDLEKAAGKANQEVLFSKIASQV
jgi:glyoxylase-like metal-dependent hydrolase (beta-lactamase superfamily II)